MLALFLSLYLKLFFIMTPFFVLSVFLTVTNDVQNSVKKALAIKLTLSITITSLILVFFGKYIFTIFGITIDAFRIGAGALLFLTAVSLVNGNKSEQNVGNKSVQDLAVVPLTIPVTIGPGTIGVLLVMASEFNSVSELVVGSIALILASITIGLMLLLSGFIQKLVGKQGLLVISKITGLILAALSAQIIFTGIKNFLNL